MWPFELTDTSIGFYLHVFKPMQSFQTSSALIRSSSVWQLLQLIGEEDWTMPRCGLLGSSHKTRVCPGVVMRTWEWQRVLQEVTNEDLLTSRQKMMMHTFLQAYRQMCLFLLVKHIQGQLSLFCPWALLSVGCCVKGSTLLSLSYWLVP